MKYPQGYIFLNETAKLPPLATLQAWFGGSADIYVRGVSKPSKVLDDRIALLEDLHRYAMKKSDYQMQCVVFCGAAVSELFLIAHSSSLLKVYWIDSAEQAKKIKQLSKHIYCAMELRHYIREVRETYSALTNYIFATTGQTLTGDADIERFFSGRDWGTTTEAEIHIRQIAKNETRAGILRRFDLEEHEEAQL
jgi:preprotein translocase subunit Sec61beta